jgi:hypothetical protein
LIERSFLRSFLLAVCLGISVFAPAQSSSTTAAAPVSAQVRIGDSMAVLNGPWKFTIGDSPIDPKTNIPLWAEPGFDDSSWETVDLTPAPGATDPTTGISDYVHGWTAKGHPGYWGYAWYRIRVRAESRPGISLALAGPQDVDDAYQVFSNGALIGAFGDFSSSNPAAQYTRPMMFVLPPADNAGGEPTRVLAFRFWMMQSTLTQGDDVGGIHTAPVLGEAGAIAARHQVRWDDLLHTYFAQPIQGVVFGILGLLALSLALIDRTDRVYLWIGTLLLMVAAQNFEAALAVWSPWVSGNFDIIFGLIVLNPVQYGWWVMVWRTWFRQRQPRWIPWALPPLILTLMLAMAIGMNMISGISAATTNGFVLLSLAIRFVLAGFMLLTVFEGIREQGIEGWLVLPAILLACVSEFYNELQRSHVLPYWFPFGIRVRVPEFTNALLVVVLSVLLTRRLLHSIRRQRLVALDLQQAHEVQQVLIPESIPEVSGFAMEAVYKPAGEVGGDFFQILPIESGGVLVVIGDVSGKGVAAAMTVSLLVGTVRTLAHYTHSPGEILSAMNYRMLGRTRGGFTTCLVVFAGADGKVTAANAGHIAPYLNGREIELQNGLPLGLVAGESYTESTIDLPLNGRITLLTDGVLEARNETGELFGFERTAAVAAGSADQIATTAKLFGQDDDITVLTLTRHVVTA